MQVADAIAHILKREGIEFIVGYPGGKEGFVKRAEELAAKYGERFTPPASLR